MDQNLLAAALTKVRTQTEALIEGLSAEDCLLQSMSDASPVKWHLAHTTWFFETFVLEKLAAHHGRPYPAAHPDYRRLFNSYYVGVGACHPRGERGMLSRPSLTEVLDYRRRIDTQMAELLAKPGLDQSWLDLIELGLQHEQQHQELILTDLKYHFWRNPLRPAYRPAPLRPTALATSTMSFLPQPGGYAELGWGGADFCFDNEQPRHGCWLQPFAIASRLVCNREYLAFMADDGYRRPELWLSDGWEVCRREAWNSPLYWQQDDEVWSVFTLAGQQPLPADEAVCHLSYYEADAYARWAEARLYREEEWENLATAACLAQASQQTATASPAPAAPQQMFGEVWQWTGSAYLPYPGFRPRAGAVGEYNGKFMINQMVLRGGSCVTPGSHLRPSYRNFFPPAARWQFSGLRLARDTG